MMQNDLVIEVFLENGDHKTPVTAKYASRYSLWVKFRQDCEFSVGDNFSLIIQNGRECVKIGPCRLIFDPVENGYNGRLVFFQDAYDIHSLLSQKKAVKLKSAFCDLPLILARKAMVKTPFKEYIANLGYDLQAYKKLFDDLDYQILQEPKDIRASVQQSLIETEGQKFLHFFHSKVEELDRIVADYSREEHHLHGSYFRMQLWNFILCCPLMARTNLKPRGYSGDSKMMEMIYLNDYQGNSTFAKLIHKYTVGTAAAQSVRARRTIILEVLYKLNERFQLLQQEEIRILSVACGPAWEIKNILATKSDFEKYHFTLMDQDQLALNEAHQLIAEIEKKLGATAQVEYVQASVRSMIGNKILKGGMGKFHFIYSMGLFDYLSTTVALKVMEKLYYLLSPQGKLVVGNFHVSNVSRNFMEYWGDWYLIHRTEDEFRNLLKGEHSADVSLIFEDTGNQMFLQVDKPVES